MVGSFHVVVIRFVFNTIAGIRLDSKLLRLFMVAFELEHNFLRLFDDVRLHGSGRFEFLGSAVLYVECDFGGGQLDELLWVT